MGDFTLAGHAYFLAAGPKGEIYNSWTEEDASPTAVQAAEGAPDAANVPTATTEYSSFGGNLGLDERVRAPGDFARWFVADWDGTRGTQLTAWVRWPGDTVALTGGGVGVNIIGKESSGSDYLFTGLALIDDPTTPGFVSVAANGSGGEYYKWDGTSFVYQRTLTQNPNVPNGAAAYDRIGNYFLPYSMPVVRDTSGLWMMDSVLDAWNIITNSASAGVVGVWAVPFYDMVLTIGSSGIITAYKPMGTTVKTESATVSGGVISTATVDATATLPGLNQLIGAVACEGVLWIASLNTVWAVQWNDQYNTFKAEELVRVPRITGPPVNWNSEVYVPCGNRLLHIKPGQEGFDWVKIDQFDVMPPPFNGRIVECVPTPDALYCKVVEDGNLSASVRAALMRFDASGAWSCVLCDQATNSTLARMPLVKTFDATNPPGIGYWVDGTHIRLLPVQDSGRNPRTMTVTARPQAAQVRGVSPWETGVARSNQKQLLRFRIEVEDVVGTTIRVAYQLPADAYATASNTFATGAAAGTGTWHTCGVVTAGSTGYSGSIDANGNGWVWVEFDGATDYGPGIGVLPLYPDYTAVRWCIEVNGDTTGAHVPTVRAFRTDREEYISKTKIITARIDLSAGMRQRGRFDGPDATDAVRDAAWVAGELAFIESLVEGKHAQTLVTPKGRTYQVELTKWQEQLRQFDDEGIKAASVQLSMKVLPLLGVL